MIQLTSTEMVTHKEFKSVKTGPITSDQPEPDWIHDLPNDNLVGAITALASEIYILKERLKATERELERHNAVPKGAIEEHQPTEEERLADQKQLRAFVKRIWSEIARPRRHAANVSPGVEKFFKQPD